MAQAQVEFEKPTITSSFSGVIPTIKKAGETTNQNTYKVLLTAVTAIGGLENMKKVSEGVA